MALNDGRTRVTAADRLGSGAGRLIRAWRTLPSDRRLAAYAAAGLFVTLFLPWYDDTVVAVGRTASASLTGWQAFSFVEAAALLVSVGVLTLLFQRAEGRAFHVPGGDGGAITAAGVWTSVLVVWRIFDKQSVNVHGPGTTVSGIQWGIFVALGVAVLLAYAGSRIRAAHQPEPQLPGEADWSPIAARRGRGPAAEDADEAALDATAATRLDDAVPRADEPITHAAGAADPGRTRPSPAQPPPVGAQQPRPVGARRPQTAPDPGADLGEAAQPDLGADRGADRGEAHAAPARAQTPQSGQRPAGWLSAPPQHRRSPKPEPSSDEQLTIPLEDQQDR